MSKQLPTMTCTKCNGQGTHPISEALAEVYSLFRGNRQICAEQVREELSLDSYTVGAVSNRLESLREIGLLTREKKGRVFVYRLAPKKGTAG